MKEKRRRRGPGLGRRKSKEFMDAALEAFVRDQALRKWHEVGDLAAAAGIGPEAALRESGDFLEKAPYHRIWRERWAEHALPAAGDGAGARFAAIEAAVHAAVLEERAARREAGDASLEDTPAYKAFVRRALGHLEEEASGEIEETV